MDPVFDVSSDEDVGWGDKLGVNDGGGDGDDCDWIQQLLNEVDRETEESNDYDDIVLVSEVTANPKIRLKNSDVAVKDLDDDDDCVVLDCDPDKPETVQNNPVVDESDELQVVGETGQVACRDYPHPRHLCVKYPFTSTPHEKHCNQCHCYVCDSLAPCLLWDVNHCHATDKEELWKIERKSLKIAHQASVPALKAPTLSAEVIKINQDPVQIPFQPTYIPQNQVTTPAAIRACSRASSCGIPETDGSGHVVPRNRFRPNLVLQHLQSTGNEAIQSDRRHVSNAGLQVKSPPSVFKRTGPGVPLMPNRRYYLSNQKYGSQCVRRAHPASTLVANNSMRWKQTFPTQMGSELNTFQLPSQSNIHANFSNPLPYQPQLSASPNIMNNLLNSVPQPMVSSQSNTGNILVSSVTFQPQLPSQPYIGSMALNSMPSQPQPPSQPVIVNSYANTMPFESQVHGQPISAQNGYQSVCHMNQDHGVLDSSLADIDLSWINESSQQPPSQYQDAGLMNANMTLPPTGMDNLFSESTNLDALNFEYDSWTLENSDDPVHSPEPDLSDSSFFFGL